MAFWLMRSEPDVYGWDDLVRDCGTEWDGVRNYTARNFLKDMAAGDREDRVAAVAGADESADLFLAVDPRDITLHTQRPEGSAQNVFAGPILELAPEPPGGERVRVVLGTRPTLVAEVTREAVDGLGLAEGLTVHASFKATGIRAYR